MKDKMIIFLGSSVTEGYASGGVSFVDLIEEKFHVNVIKEAVSGTTLIDRQTNGKDSYITRMKRIDTTLQPDAFVCQLSTNDATQNVPLGAVNLSENEHKHNYDVMKVAGAIEYIIDYARKTWNCPVFFYTNPRYNSPVYEEMVHLLYDISEKWKIEIIDLWNDEKVTQHLSGNYDRYMADLIHPTREGYEEIFLPVFCEKLGLESEKI